MPAKDRIHGERSKRIAAARIWGCKSRSQTNHRNSAACQAFAQDKPGSRILDLLTMVQSARAVTRCARTENPVNTPARHRRQRRKRSSDHPFVPFVAFCEHAGCWAVIHFELPFYTTVEMRGNSTTPHISVPCSDSNQDSLSSEDSPRPGGVKSRFCDEARRCLRLLCEHGV